MRCGGWLVNRNGDCLRCDGGPSTNPSKTCDSVGELMQGAKGCTTSNECVICEPQTAPPEQKNVLRKIASGRLMNVSVYISSTCTNYIDGEHAGFSGVLSAKALKNVIVEGGKPAGVEIKAGDSATVRHVSSSGTISIQSKLIKASNLVFDGLYSGLVVHGVNIWWQPLTALLMITGRAGASSMLGMTARNCNCSDIDGFSDQFCYAAATNRPQPRAQP